jgi:hypothetical protein
VKIDSYRLSDILERGVAEIGDRQIKPPLDLAIGVLGKTDAATLADPFQTRSASWRQVDSKLLIHRL